MLSENIILQSAGSLSVAVLALLMLILQALFFFRKPQFTWYAWSSAISFSALLYSVGIFLEYNTPAGPLNRFSGLLEYTAIIFLIHCLYGFTFSYLGLESKRYHPVAGVCHGLILILLWFTNYIVADSFTTRNFIGLEFPYIEPALGPLGPVFVLYAALAGVTAMIVWIKHKRTDPKHRITYLAGIGFWILLGFHDALASLGVPTFQYIMEYGFLGFALVVLWVVFDNYLEIEAEEKYRVITEFVNDCILLIQDGKIVYGNPACRDLIGRPLSDSEPRDFLDIIASEDRKTVLEHYNTLLEGGRVPKTHTVRIRRTDGEQRFVEIASSVIRYRNKPAVLAVIWDMTERKLAEEALRESEERLRTAGKAAYDLIYEWDVASDAIEWFGDIDGLLGYRKGEISKDIKAWLDLIHSEDSVKLKNAVELHRTSIEPIQYEYRVRHKDGTYRHWNDHALPVLDDKGCPHKWVGVCTDITARKRAEEALRESEEKLARYKKMESLALLAGGVAHDLNNVLSGIVGYPELILMDLPQDSELRKPIETMQESGFKAVAIVQDLLTVARGVAITREPVNLNDIVSDYLQSPEFKKTEQFHPTVTVKTNLDIDLLNVSGSHVHISKVVMNLVSNALEAVESSGHVTISTMNHYVDRPIKGYDDVTIGEYAILSVSNDGSEISSDDLERIFEPFYTKKIMGRSGTGLGLTVVWNIMQNHEGYIDVITDENGTTFDLYFPITRDEVADKSLSVPIKDYKGDGETILVVDDVESQRKISCEMLDTLGYKTKAVSSGEEAVEYLKGNTVDLILLDMIMDPGINGRETYERIIKIHPNQKAIIVSGFAETENVKAAQKLGAGKYIKKPVTLEKIGLAVKEELGK